MKHHLVSRIAIHNLLKKEGKRIAVDALPQIEEEVRSLLLKAVQRAEISGRRTILRQDI